MADAPESFDDYLRRRISETFEEKLWQMRFYGTTDPDEIARLDERGPNVKGISVA